MEQIDPSTLVGELLSGMLPESLSSRVPALPRLNALRKALSSTISHKNAAAPAPPPPRWPTGTGQAGNPRPEQEPSARLGSDAFLSDGETDTASYISSRASTAPTSVSSVSSVGGYEYAVSPHPRLGPPLSPPVVEDQHLRLIQKLGKQRRLENRLGPGFGDHSYDGVDCGWSPSGIRWRYARQGAQLTSSAARELDDPSFERRSYIDGVAYYLRACPEDLTQLETEILLRSAPWLAVEQAPPAAKVVLKQPSDRGKTLLHRTVQYCVAGFVVVVHALWCWVLLLGRLGLRYESQYHISSHILAHGSTLAHAVGRHSVVLVAWVQKVSDGHAGQLMSGLAAWAVDSFSGGILDGYGDGIVMIRRDKGGEAAAVGEESALQHSS